ncbi:MAG: hypothetical protein EOM16_10310, partial [Bacteroidia bacterium]|nr:hypothetical protein [Bacteroidia bacterium]
YTTTYNTIQSTPRADGMFDVKWANGSDFQAKNGEMKALIDARDVVVDSYIGQLNTAAKALAELTNAFHQSGFGLGGDTDTGNPFFIIPGESVGSQGKGTGNANWNGVAPIITTQGNTDELNEVTITFANPPTTTGWDPVSKTLTISEDWASSSFTESELQDIINQGLAAEGIEEKIFLNMRGATSSDIVGGTDIDILGGTNPTAEFTGKNITVNPDLIADVTKIAAAKAPVTDLENGIGDNGNALKLAQIKYDKSAINGFTVDDYYRSMIGDIGINANKAKSMANNQELLVSQINTQREYVMGVSLDEEMTNMIQFQQAYNSSARFLTTVDEMLDVLVNRLGRVGL